MTTPNTAPQQTEEPTVSEWTIETQTGMMTFTGKLLGRGTTETTDHRGHREDTFAQRGQRCSACRWFTCEVYELTTGDGRYLVYTRGETRVPGEDVIPRVTFSSNALGVMQILIQKQPLSRPNPHDRDTWTWSRPRLSRSARAALEQASIYDMEIRSTLADHNGRAA
jgi:hypothetical protein